MLMHNPTVGTFAGFIVEPIDVLTMDIHIPMGDILLTPMEDILLTPMGDILLTPMGDILVHPFSGDGTNAIGTRQAQKVDRCGINLHARLQRPQDYQES
jgi:hypothetical protein